MYFDYYSLFNACQIFLVGGFTAIAATTGAIRLKKKILDKTMADTFGEYKVKEKRVNGDTTTYIIHCAAGKGLEDYVKKIGMMEKLYKGKIEIQDIPYTDLISIKCYKKDLVIQATEEQQNNIEAEIQKILNGGK